MSKSVSQGSKNRDLTKTLIVLILAVVESSRYDRIYSSPTFEVYLKGMVEQ